MYDTLVLNGRFQLFSRAHKRLLDEALDRAPHVITILGSADIARNPRNPFTASERAKMIQSCYGESTNKRIHFLGQRDYPYNNDKYVTSVRSAVDATTTSIYGFTDKPKKIGIIGHVKDKHGAYIRNFHEWDTIEIENHLKINATDLRAKFFEGELISEELVHPNVLNELYKFSNTEDYKNLVDEYQHYKDYKLKWASSPFPPTFNTVDAVVVKNGCILMIQRKMLPGKNLWALPGGFIEQDQTILEALIAELTQETTIKLKEEEILSSISWSRRFDHPFRSLRGRVITDAFLIKLRGGGPLPKVKGGDDAKKAKWIKIEDIRRDELFDDHGDIIETMLGI
jgi:bifunctional NMN adenylyltransferase/nudix hydrolase